MTTALAFFFGISIGSFLNMCAYRLPKGLSLTYPRSRCSRCGFIIPWYDNVPVLSCIVLQARCRRCLVKFSWAHMYVELFMGLAAVWIYKTQGVGFVSFYQFFVLSILMVVTLVDLELRIIPDELSLGGLALGLFLALGLGALGTPWFVSPMRAVLGAFIGGAGLWFVGWFYEKISGKEGIGMGDMKLLAMMGAHVGPEGVLSVIFISSLLGSIVGLSLILFNRLRMKSAIPFGPFLCVAFILEWMFKPQLSEWLLSVCKVCMPLVL